MLERTYSQMLRWANRWKNGIYHSMKRAAIAAKGFTIPIYKIWAPDRPEPRKRVDRRRLTSPKPIKYKDIKITNKMNVTKTHRSTSVVSKQFYTRQYRGQMSVQDFTPATFELDWIYALFGEAFNN